MPAFEETLALHFVGAQGPLHRISDFAGSLSAAGV
jgi:hypothetical protein